MDAVVFFRVQQSSQIVESSHANSSVQQQQLLLLLKFNHLFFFFPFFYDDDLSLKSQLIFLAYNFWISSFISFLFFWPSFCFSAPNFTMGQPPASVCPMTRSRIWLLLLLWLLLGSLWSGAPIRVNKKRLLGSSPHFLLLLTDWLTLFNCQIVCARRVTAQERTVAGAFDLLALGTHECSTTSTWCQRALNWNERVWPGPTRPDPVVCYY